MRRPMRIAAASAIVYGLCGAALARTAHYYDLTTQYELNEVDSLISVRLGAQGIKVTPEEFFNDNPTLDDTVEVIEINREFFVFGIRPEYGLEDALEDIESDSTSVRVEPVYTTTSGGVVFVTDLVSVKFADDLPAYSALAILEENGLYFVDSSRYMHNRWTCGVEDSMQTSALHIGNELHMLAETDWACATMSAGLARFKSSVDPYFQHQYYLQHTLAHGGIPDADIDADSAWEFGLATTDIVVAVIDDGIAPHVDLPGTRLLTQYGRDFVGPSYETPTPDTLAEPGQCENHGMACAGILAAEQ